MSAPKKELKPHVAEWLDQLDACFEESKVRVGGRVEIRRKLVRPFPGLHTGWLRRLVTADYSPLVTPAEWEALPASGEAVTLERSEFPAYLSWTIIKKWDHYWRKLRVIERIERCKSLAIARWEDCWRRQRGGISPYTRLWIQYENLVSINRIVYGDERLPELDQEFPAVAIMRRIEAGGAPKKSDIPELEKLGSDWCKSHVLPARSTLKKIAKKAANCELIDRMYAAALAKDIQARHEIAKGVVRHWSQEWCGAVSGLFDAIGNPEYLYELRKIVPLQMVGDPGLEQARRVAVQKRDSERRKRPARKASVAANPERPKASPFRYEGRDFLYCEETKRFYDVENLAMYEIVNEVVGAEGVGYATSQVEALTWVTSFGREVRG